MPTCCHIGGVLLLAAFGVFALAIPASPARAQATMPKLGLDQKRIHAAYSDGEFEAVIAQINAFTRAHPSHSRLDSLFIAKHLAVVYSASPETREKGKHYMFQLLELLPSAKIVDMFVSDEIDRIFERVREEFNIRKAENGKDASTLHS